MVTLKERIDTLIKNLDQVAEMFYQQKTQEAYEMLNDVLGEFSAVIDAVYHYQTEHPDLTVDLEGMLQALEEAVSAVEERDAILVADVLKYELEERLQAVAALL